MPVQALNVLGKVAVETRWQPVIVKTGYGIGEVSGIVGYLISNFISKYINRRNDQYGGDIHGRCLFMKILGSYPAHS